MGADGLCECGCGGAAPIAKVSDAFHGRVKGEPVRFIKWHSGRGRKPGNWKGGSISHGGYVALNEDGRRIFEHRDIAEKALGKPLPPNAVVHHHGKEKADNKKNLVLCQDQAYHLLLHIRTRALEACGNVNYRKCVYCTQHDDPSKMTAKKTNGKEPQYFHAECRSAYRRSAKRRAAQ
jgi:hypothetical protein